MRKTVIALIAVFVLFAGAASAFAAEGTSPVKTKITGVKKTQSKSYKETITDTIKVSPAYGRKVYISVYNPYQKKWEVKKVYTTANTKTASVKVVYPAVWKAYGTAKWKIKTPKTVLKAGTSTITAKSKTKYVTVNNRFLKAKAAVVMDAVTGQCVYSYNATSKRKIASMTKMMTMILLAENRGLNERVKINWEAVRARSMSGGMGLKNGDVVTVKDLMYCALLPSANDAAAASAVAVSGSQEKFKHLMKSKAVSIGATDSTYKYAFGDWWGDAKSTAFDQALIGRYFMTSNTTAFLRKVVRTKRYSFTTKKKNIRYTVSSEDAGNLILGQYGSIGIKTGYNPPAGRCFTNAWYYKGRLYISVTMGEPSANQLWKDVKKLTLASNYLVDQRAGQVLVKAVR